MGRLSKTLLTAFRRIRSRLGRRRNERQTLRRQLSRRVQEQVLTIESGGNNVAIFARDQTDAWSSAALDRTETIATLPSYHTENTPVPEYTAQLSNADEIAQESSLHYGSNNSDAAPETSPSSVNESNGTTSGPSQDRVSEPTSQHDSELTSGPKMTFSGSTAVLLLNAMEGHQERKQLRERLEDYEASEREAKSRLRAEMNRLNGLIEALSDNSDSGSHQSIIQAIQAGRGLITYHEESCLVWEGQVSSLREELDEIEAQQARLVQEFFDRSCAAMLDHAEEEDAEQGRLINELADRPCGAIDENAFAPNEEEPEPEAEVEREVSPSPVHETPLTNNTSSHSGSGPTSNLSLEALHRAATVNELEYTFHRLQELHYQIDQHNYDDAYSDYLAEQAERPAGPEFPTKTEFDLNFLAEEMELGRELRRAEIALKETKHRARLLGIDIRRYRTTTDIEQEAAIAAAADPGYGYPASFEAELSGMVDRARIESWLNNTRTDGVSNQAGNTTVRAEDEGRGMLNDTDAEMWESESVRISDSISMRAFGRDRRRIDGWRQLWEESF